MTTGIAEILTRRERIAPLQFDYASRATVEVKRCNACGSNKSALLCSRDRYGFPAHTRVCDHCGLGWLSPRMTREAYLDFYATWYRTILTAWYGYDMREELQTHQKNYGDAMLKSERLTKELKRKSGGSLLDVGGSTGVVAEMLMQAFGYFPTVLDPCGEELDKAKARGCDTILGLAEDAPPDKKYDVIAMLQTIEHLLDPRGVLLKLKAMLQPGGVILFDFVPFCQQRAGVRPIEKVLKIDHPFYFSKYAVDEMLGRIGLVVRTFDACTGRQFHYVVEAA